MEDYIPVCFDFSARSGVIKPMNGVNNGPACSEVRGDPGNLEAYTALEIPFARYHDAAFCAHYDWEFTVDVHRIFRDFSADENAPASYSFKATDVYVARTFRAGTEPFYRLGCNIEHGEKNGTFPPPDFEKWARICEHIIRHYTEGWADGFTYGIRYWEIWNEPDCVNPDGSNPCWQGTAGQFLDFFETAARHLKASFPHLKIGGPAFTTLWGERQRGMLAELGLRKVPLDFVSYHGYGCEPKDFEALIRYAREQIDLCGYPDAEAILNEWNYIHGWLGADWKYSLRTEKNLKGASYIAACMAVGQNAPVDMLMYYDARPCVMNGLFDTDTLEPLPGYYAFAMFRELRRLGGCVPAEQNHTEGIYACAASDGEAGAILLTHFEDSEDAPVKWVRADCSNICRGGKIRAEYWLLDDGHRMTRIRDEIFTADAFSLYLEMPLYTSWLIRLVPQK